VRGLIASLLLLAACSADDVAGQGTIVGNPGDAELQIAPGEEVTYTEAWALVNTVEQWPCEVEGVDVEPIEMTIEAEFDLLSGGALPVEPGPWCEYVVVFGDTLGIDGVGTSGGSFNIDLAVEEIILTRDGGFVVDGDAFVLEVGAPGWISASLLELEEGANRQIIPDRELFHDALAWRVHEETALYQDTDRDGDLSEDERAVGPVAGGSAAPALASDDDVDVPRVNSEEVRGGCGAGDRSAVALLPLLLLGLRRRR
jgi:hypothetical protein